MFQVEDTIEIHQFFVVQVSCTGYMTQVRTLNKVVQRRCNYEIACTGEETAYQWNFDSEKLARSAAKRLLAANIDGLKNLKLCKLSRVWASQTLKVEER